MAPLEPRQGTAPEIALIKNRLNLHGVSPKGSSSSPLLRFRCMNMRWPVARLGLPATGQTRWDQTADRGDTGSFAGFDGEQHGSYISG